MKQLAWVFSMITLTAPMVRAQSPANAGPSGPSELSATVLYDNGPLVNSPGTGPGGADESLARDLTAGLTSRGFNQSLSGAFRVADDFTVTGPSWNVASITFYPYMGGSPTTPSPVTGVNLRIWNGSPDLPASAVVFGDTTTNRLTGSSFANIYRRKESEPTDATRPVMTALTAVVVTLPPGTYWLDWQVDGNSAYTGPWAPPVTIDGQTTTGNALQFATGAWQPVADAGLLTALGLPFVIEGSLASLFADGFGTGNTSLWSATVP